ncbi:MAG: hypothetical protein ACL93V_03390 [Candidatus Electrothrix sp. YB6]
MQNKRNKTKQRVRIKTIKIALAGCLALLCTSTVTAVAADAVQSQVTPEEFQQALNKVKTELKKESAAPGNTAPASASGQAAAGVQVPIPASQMNAEGIKGLKLDQETITKMQESIMQSMASSDMVGEMQKKVMAERMQSLQNSNALQGKIQSTMQDSMQRPAQKDAEVNSTSPPVNQ